MNWLDKLQRKYGRYAVHNLTKYMTIMYAAGLLIQIFAPGFYEMYLCLNMSQVLKGQIWRLVTFVLYPPGGDLFFSLIMMVIYYQLGNTLAGCWGAFRYNLYIFSGVIFHIIAALLVTLIEGSCVLYGVSYLNMTMLLAFVTEFPDTQFYLFYFIPIKAKWIGIVDAAYLGLIIVCGLLSPLIPSIQISDFSTGVLVLFCVLNYIVYFFSMPGSRFSPKQVKRRADFNRKVNNAGAKKVRAGKHRCAVCGRTEADGENLEFRFCSKCNGNYEYCQDHLYTHMHVE